MPNYVISYLFANHSYLLNLLVVIIQLSLSEQTRQALSFVSSHHIWGLKVQFRQFLSSESPVMCADSVLINGMRRGLSCCRTGLHLGLHSSTHTLWASSLAADLLLLTSETKIRTLALNSHQTKPICHKQSTIFQKKNKKKLQTPNKSTEGKISSVRNGDKGLGTPPTPKFPGDTSWPPARTIQLCCCSSHTGQQPNNTALLQCQQSFLEHVLQSSSC